MGCTASNYKSIKIETLTPKEKELIKNTWCLIKSKEDFGIQIMFR